MREQFPDKVLFVFSDPGGAKPCLALRSELHDRKLLSVSDRVHAFYENFSNKVLMFNGLPETYFNDFKPDLVFTGTSYTSDIEQKFIKKAKLIGIPCWSFVDHWTSLKQRFLTETGELNFPDQIWVIDQQAKELAIEEGIEHDRLYISGNPYHKWLINWKPKITKEAFLKNNGIDECKQKIIVIAPDPLSNVNGRSVYGFDEISALSTIKLLIEQQWGKTTHFLFLIKAHPNQNRERLNRVIEGCDFLRILPADTDANECIHFADLIIGFFSSFLLEAKIMNKEILRFLDADSKNDPFVNMEVGTIVNRHNLVPQILKKVYEVK